MPASSQITDPMARVSLRQPVPTSLQNPEKILLLERPMTLEATIVYDFAPGHRPQATERDAIGSSASQPTPD